MQVTIEGTVFSGKGEGKKFVSLPWVTKQIGEFAGFLPYLGTLNILLSKENQNKKLQMQTAGGFVIKPEQGFFEGKLFPAKIEGVACAVIIPLVPNYPENVLEIVAKENLREKLKIKDGSHVKVDYAD
ncbi:MAG: CTP-dependent riboflavin kinase [Candidatus Bathyarchaeota archaeon]|nr:CTP-dependent riboflavin kinase [Candidatus Bathyarchaeota archaeon]